MATKNNAVQTLKVQTENVQKLAESMRLLDARIKALQEDNKSLLEIEELLGDQMESLRKEYISTTDESVKLASSHKKLAETDKQVEIAVSKLTTSVTGLGTAYGRLKSFQNDVARANEKVKNSTIAAAEANDRDFNRQQKEASTERLNTAKEELRTQNELAKKRAIDEAEVERQITERKKKARSIREAREKSHTARMIRENNKVRQSHEAAHKEQQTQHKERVADIEQEWAGIKKLADADKKLADAQEAAAQKGQLFGKSFREAFSPQAIGRAIASIVKFIGLYQIIFGTIQAVKQLFIGSAQAFIKFEDAMGKLNSVTLSTAEQSKNLENSIRQTAVQTRFTATEVAGLATALAKLGASAGDIPNLLGPISAAAQATGESLDSVGETVLKVNNQFGISSLESAVTAATLVRAINDSALSLETFNTAIQYIGPIASQVGLTFGETAEYLKALADNGFTASRIGTGLRSIFLELKKPGEDINKTLDELAKKNISVAEAMELVGKRAAAQLLTILRTKETFDAQKEAVDSLALSYAASAAQMSTYAGKMDILKSAFEEFELKIGKSILSTKVFMKLIGLLSPESERLAAGYELIAFATQKNTNALSDNIDALIDGQSGYESMLKTLKSSGLSFDEFEYNFARFNNQIKDLNVNLTKDEAFKAFALAIHQDVEGLAEFTVGLEKAGKKIGPDFQRKLLFVGEQMNATFGSPDNIREQATALLGYYDRIEEGAESYMRSARAEEYRNNIQKQYKEELEEIEKLGVKNEQAQTRALKLEVRIGEERTKLVKKLKREESKGSGASDERILQLKAEIAGLDEYMQILSEYNAELIDGEDEKSKKQMSNFNKEKKALEIRRQEIQNDINQAKKNYDDEVRRINSLYDLKDKSAKTDEERAKNDKERIEIINQLRKQQLDALAIYTKEEEELSLKAEALWKKYNDLWAKNESFLMTVENAQDSFRLSLVKLIQEIQESRKDVILTPEELGIELYQRAVNIMQGFSDEMSNMRREFDESGKTTKGFWEYFQNGASDSAYSLYNFGLQQREQLEGTKSLLKTLQDEYDIQFQALIRTGSSEDVAKAILAPQQASIDAMTELFKKAKEGTLTDADLEALKGKFKILSEDVILNIDTTLRDTLQLAIDTALDGLQKFNQTAFENTKDRLDREKDELKSRFDFEDDILKSKLDNQLITEAEYRAQVERNRKAEVQAQNQIDRQIFQAEQKKARQDAMIDYLSALNSIVPNLIVTNKEGDPVSISLKAAISAAMATASYGMEVRAINQRQFFPTKFAEGGVVYGPSHEEGGVPFSVAGQSGYEMEGGEYIVNKRATSKYRSLLDKINDYGRSSRNYAMGGVVDNPMVYQRATLEFLSSIAESNVDIVGKLDKPVRSFVASDDLRSDENARRIKSRNSQL